MSRQFIKRAARLTWMLLALVLVATTAEAKNKSGGNYGAINIGPSGIVGYFKGGSPHFTVVDVAKGSPADGRIKKDDVIISVNGRALDGFPAKGGQTGWKTKNGSRYVLGASVTEAEGSDGVLKFGVKRGSKKISAAVKIPVLGEYSQTWPVNCKKSDQIVRDIADFLISIQDDEGRFHFPTVELPKGLSGYGKNMIGHYMAGLFLLSTGEEKDLEAAKKFAATVCGGERTRDGGSSWYLGYQGLFLGEYYLRTGDERAKITLASICENLAAHDKVGGWGHKLEAVNPGYVRGGLMNSAGINCFKAYLLARECGIEVDEAAFLRTLHFFYKFAGKGSTPYGDHRPRINGSANGKGPSTVCTYILMDDPRATRASQHGAITGMDTFGGFEGGHTGNGFNIMWRGIAAVHVPKEFDYRRQKSMDALAWYYDLARGHDGSVRFMPVPGGETRYASTCWGTGAIGLHYTAHRKTLRITGKPRGKFNANPKLPADELWRWYEQPDSDFLKVGFCEGGKDLRESIGEYDKMQTPTVEECEILMRHYDGYIRKSFANKLSMIALEDGTIDPRALDAIERALQHPDQRVQRAATEAISGQNPWFALRQTKSLVTAEMIGNRFSPYLVKILQDEKTDIWLKDGALWAIARADGETIMKNIDLIEQFDNDRLWWLRQSARARVHGLSQSQMVNYKTIQAILKAKQTEGRAFPSTDLTFHTQAAMSGSKLSKEEQAEIVLRMVAQRLKGGPAADRMDDYGYAPPKDRMPGDSSGFFPLIQGVPAELYPVAFPLLLATIDRWGDPKDNNPVTPQFGMMFYGVKRFEGIMGVLQELGEDLRPVMQRLKQFLYSDEVAVARAKFMPDSGLGAKRKRFDPNIVRLKESVTEWEKKNGKLDVKPTQRVGKTYQAYIPPPPAPTDDRPAEASARTTEKKPAAQPKTVVWTGTLKKVTVPGRDGPVTEFILEVDGESHTLPTASRHLLPVSLSDLVGATLELKCQVLPKVDRKKKKTVLHVQKVQSLKVLSGSAVSRGE